MWRSPCPARRHDGGEHRIEITNWFANDANLCVEYTHGFVSTGKFTAGIRGKLKSGVSRYCITYHIRDGKFDRVHEYINATSWSFNGLVPLLLAYLHRNSIAKRSRLRNIGAPMLTTSLRP